MLGEKLVSIIQEQLSLKVAPFYFPIFCLNLLDFKTENNFRLFMLFYVYVLRLLAK